MKISINKWWKRKKDENIISFEDKIKRTGAIEDELEIKRKQIEKQKVKKVFIGMCMLSLLTATLNLKYGDYLKVEELDNQIHETVPVSSSIDDDEKIILATKAKEELIFIPALEGEIQKIYSKDNVIYSKTLKQWKTHQGIDITTGKYSDVKAIEKGVVQDVYEDKFYGITVVIEHIDGYVSKYSNLDKNVFVDIGQSVIKGQKIGKVGNTSIGEYLDDPHLHFELYLWDKVQNPTYIFK